MLSHCDDDPEHANFSEYNMSNTFKPVALDELTDEKIKELGLTTAEVEKIRALNPLKYTDQARYVIDRSLSEVGRYEAPLITSGHILSSLFYYRRQVVSAILQLPEKVIRLIRRQIEINLLQDEVNENPGNVMLSEELKQALDIAAQEAAQAGKDKINIGHLLLGFMYDDQSYFVRQLINYESDVGALRERAREYAVRTDAESVEVVTGNPVDFSMIVKIEPRSRIGKAVAKFFRSMWLFQNL